MSSATLPTPGPDDRATCCHTAEPVLKQCTLAQILMPLRDLRERTGAEYHAWFERLKANIKEHGIQVPLIGYEEGDKVRLGDGATRFTAALMLGLATIPVVVYPRKPSEEEMALGQLIVNSMRADMTPLEYARIYVDLMKAMGISQAELARRIHASPSQVAIRLAISQNLCADVQAMMVASQLSPRSAYAISRLPDPQQQIELAKRAIDLPMAVEDVEAAAAKILGKRERKPKPWKVKLGGVTATIRGDLMEGAESLIAKLQELVKRLKRGDGPDPLAGLVK
jgi:ParB/RepB/Spo0J family partition protein